MVGPDMTTFKAKKGFKGVQSIKFYCCFRFCYHEGLILNNDKMMFKTNLLFA